MPKPAEPIVAYLVHATRDDRDSKLRVREFLVGIPNRDAAAGAVISAYPELDDGYHVEASIGITQENAGKLALMPGEIRDCGETEL
jgi:hypothetical protein